MTAADLNEEVFACPVFEGSEKRICVSFAAGPSTPEGGLRTLTREQVIFRGRSGLAISGLCCGVWSCTVERQRQQVLVRRALRGAERLCASSSAAGSCATHAPRNRSLCNS